MRRHDVEGQHGPFNFDEVSIRMAFMRKVFLILTVQLSVTFGCVLMCVFNDSFKETVIEYQDLQWYALGITLFCVLIIFCCEDCRRQTPTNYILLAIFTLAESFLVSVLVVQIDEQTVILGFAITIGVTFVLTVIALQTRFDLTICVGFMAIVTFVFVFVGIVMIFLPKTKLTILMFCGFGALMFGMWLIIDIQLMMGGNKAYSISPEDYVFAALNIFIDIVGLFRYIIIILEMLDN